MYVKITYYVFSMYFLLLLLYPFKINVRYFRMKNNLVLELNNYNVLNYVYTVTPKAIGVYKELMMNDYTIQESM